MCARSSRRRQEERTTHLEVLDDERERGREEHDLALLGHEGQELLDDGRELGREELVGLVHDEHGALAQVGDALAGEVEDAAGRADEDVDLLAEAQDVVAQGRAARRHHDVGARVLAERLAHLGRLEGELARRDEEERLDLGHLGVDALERRDDERGRLARAVLGAGEDVAPGEGDRDGLLLDGRRSLELRGRRGAGVSGRCAAEMGDRGRESRDSRRPRRCP